MTSSKASMADSSAVEIQAGPVPQPFGSFDSFPVSDEIKAGIAGLGYKEPTDVQAAVIEPASQGKDLVVQARTGSGKTCAFGVPLLDRVAKSPGKACEPRALVLTPTRELAHQVAQELRAIASKKTLRIYAIYGGMPMGRQIVSLRGGVDVVVGTPGRLLDHIRRKNLVLSGLQTVVLDEADEMLSMGFWDEVTEILNMCPAERQTMLFSATLPYEVAKAASQYLREPARIDVSADQLTVDGIDNLIFHTTSEMPKPRQLMYVLEAIRPESAIIFCNTRNETELIAKFLTQSGFIAEPLSGNMRQRDRERTMARIKSQELRYMVATDIAARGIDINDLSHVFNYSLPEFTEVYVHRVGRTGRVGKLGTAVSLVDGTGLATLSRLEREFGIKFIERALPPEEEASRLRSERIMKELTEKASVSEVGAHLPVAQQILANPEGAAQVVAYLLKSYYAAAAAEGERHVQQPAGGGRPPRHENNNAGGAGDAAGLADAEGDANGRRRRRRRRGRRGERGSEPSEHHNDGFETINAHEALAGETTSAPVGDALPTPDGAGVAAPSNGNGQTNGGGAPVAEVASDGFTRIRVNIGFDDGFKGRGAVAKRVAALAGLTDGSVLEVESRREYSVLKAAPHIAELLIDRVDGTPIGKKILTVQLAQ